MYWFQDECGSLSLHRYKTLSFSPTLIRLTLTERTEYLSGETEESLGFDHLFQHVTLDASRAVIFIHHSVLQVDVVYCQTYMVLLPVDDGYSVEFVHHL